MSSAKTSHKKEVFTAQISANKHIRGPFYRLSLEFTDSAAKKLIDTKPGQFVELDLAGVGLPASENIPEELADSSGRAVLLRRPFSFCDIAAKKNITSANIIYCVVGPATVRMSNLRQGHPISVIGPLGNGFSVPEGKNKAILIAGGMGVGPLIHLGKILAEEHYEIETVVLAGAKTKFDLPFEKPPDEISEGLGFAIHEFAQYSIESFVATDDGSTGFAGLVSDCFADWLEKSEIEAARTVIYACGPEAMLAKIGEIAKEKNIDCQVSMERLMACGIGVCQSCAVECRIEGSKETVYKLCCKDGPVFDAKEVVFLTEKSGHKL
jgi:dihydroorotate dehydrogenase electron transfer subunit